jgi:hypothetical protein
MLTHAKPSPASPTTWSSRTFSDLSISADLARLPAVSRAMRAAVAETGLRLNDLGEKRAVELGCVSAVQSMQRQGRLSRRELLCQAAARSGQLEKLKELRADGWPWGTRTCHKAAEGGHLKVLLWARKNGCPCDENELHIAAPSGHEAVVRALIEAGADINKARDNGVTPLYIAAQQGHEAVVRALIEAGADVNKARDTGGTPLFTAALEGHTAIVQILRDAVLVQMQHLSL